MIWCLGLGVWLAAGQPSGAQAPAVATTAPNTVLVLRNGRTIEGRVAPAGEYYYVGVPGGKLRIRADQVELWCRDLEEGYQQKQAAVHPGRIEDHLRLARWCLRQKLYGHVAEELSAARSIDPTHPTIEYLRRQMATAATPPPPPAEPAAVTEKSKAKKKPAGPTSEQLDAMIEELPSDSVETFTRSIQPLLVNSCGSAACHGPGSESAFELRRIPLGRPASRLTTQQNLHEAIEWIDRLKPGSSPLLNQPAGPHGPAKSPIFSKAQAAQYGRLAAWVDSLAEGRPEPLDPMPASDGGMIANGATAVPGLLAQPSEVGRLTPPDAAPDIAPDAAASPVEPASFEEPAPSSEPGELPPVEVDELPLPGNVQRGAPIEGFTPEDPFDPEQFNRRYSPGK